MFPRAARALVQPHPRPPPTSTPFSPQVTVQVTGPTALRAVFGRIGDSDWPAASALAVAERLAQHRAGPVPRRTPSRLRPEVRVRQGGGMEGGGLGEGEG
jgi:hypothetical protein